MFSSEPFSGAMGLDFFLDRRLTLDYRSRRVGSTDQLLPEKLDDKRYLSVDLVEPPKSQGRILYARARVNGREAIVYLDTGYNVSFIDPGFAEGLARVERPGKFKVFRERVPLELAGHRLILDDLRESPIRRGNRLRSTRRTGARQRRSVPLHSYDRRPFQEAYPCGGRVAALGFSLQPASLSPRPTVVRIPPAVARCLETGFRKLRGPT
jgi:hypothetical protein